MSKAALSLALPALSLGLLLSQTSPEQRLRSLALVQGMIGQGTTVGGAPAPRVAAAVRSASVDSLAGSTAIEVNRLGQFETTMEIAGRSLPALIDTGASYVALTADAAASIGLHPGQGDFRYAVSTANGMTRVAAAVVPAIRVGNVEAVNVPVVIAAAGALTGHSLLGMSFLRKLTGFQVQADRLVLKQ